MTLRLDYSNMMISPGGIDQKAWAAAGKQFADAKRGFDSLRATGTVGFVDLPADKRLLEQVATFASAARGKYDDVVILASADPPSAQSLCALRSGRAGGTCSMTKPAAAERPALERVAPPAPCDPSNPKRPCDVYVHEPIQ